MEQKVSVSYFSVVHDVICICRASDSSEVPANSNFYQKYISYVLYRCQKYILSLIQVSVFALATSLIVRYQVYNFGYTCYKCRLITFAALL